ncbi:hypothetical protein EVAR_49013_1 [Eumeta japonica]|uniref:Uncharacterized protein n=1 Tax=Eumeta variegata TaxID=151549 RepID=A0A4C1XQ85_EUMVA|nr:hypothetical protein EVAR_49013_1 [Eumeta japonica]
MRPNVLFEPDDSTCDRRPSAVSDHFASETARKSTLSHIVSALVMTPADVICALQFRSGAVPAPRPDAHQIFKESTEPTAALAGTFDLTFIRHFEILRIESKCIRTSFTKAFSKFLKMEIAQNFMGPAATDTMNRINDNSNVIGTIIVNCEGFPETTTLDSLTAATYSNHMRSLCRYAANAVKELVCILCLSFIAFARGKRACVPSESRRTTCGKTKDGHVVKQKDGHVVKQKDGHVVKQKDGHVVKQKDGHVVKRKDGCGKMEDGHGKRKDGHGNGRTDMETEGRTWWKEHEMKDRNGNERHGT